MTIKIGENKSLTLNNMTTDGILFNIYLKATTVNVAILPADFVAQEVSLKVELKRAGGNMNIISDNMQIVGMYSALQYGIDAWVNGNILTAAAAAVKEDRIISVFVPFGGPINLKGTDELAIQVLAGRACFSAAIDGAISYIEFNAHPAVGYEFGTPQLISQVVQANITQERYSIGDFVTKLVFLNFDQTTIATPVINNVMISSDKWNFQANFYDVLNHNMNCNTPAIINYGATATSLPTNPQCFVFWATPKNINEELSNVQVQASYNGGVVNASKNFWVATRFKMSSEQLAKAQQMMAKHRSENIAKVATS